MHLDETEIKVSEVVGKARFDRNRNSGNFNAKRGDQSNMITDVDGVAAEIAYCKMVNVSPDLVTEIEKPNYWDCIVNGYKVDVKQTGYSGGRLSLATRKIKDGICDFYVLITGSIFKSKNFVFRGYMHRYELIKDERVGTLRKGLSYIATQDELSEGMIEIDGWRF